MEKYKNIQIHYETCLLKNGDSHLGVDWPNYTDMIKRYKEMLNIINFLEKKQRYSVLDFGAGCGGLYNYIKSKNYNLDYTALDISSNFCHILTKKFPNIKVINCDILKKDLQDNYDVVIMNGVFTEKRDLTDEEMWTFFTQMLKKIWCNTNFGLSFNVMTPIVDYKNDTLFYLSFDKLGIFLRENLSKNYIINHSYGLWDYTVYVFKVPL